MSARHREHDAIPMCVCGHDQSLHEHYRNGTDCSVRTCTCPGFVQSWRDWLRRVATGRQRRD